MVNNLITPPCSLYVHTPWCVRKCPYCDFNSHEAEADLPEAAYLAALLNDLSGEVEYFSSQRPLLPLTSVFFGGGTPSLLAARTIARVIEEARAMVGFADPAEITLEANPGAIDQAKFQGLRDAGVNRLSLGVQSFASAQLTELGRIHSQTDIYTAWGHARNCGFDNINLDLMFGLPGQSLAQALHDLDCAIALEPEHISWYQLTIEPNTEFYSKPPVLPEDDLIGDIHQTGIERLAKAGYQQYEVSAFARPGCEARHNLNYWKFGDYLAIGAGAHGKCTNIHQSTINRHWKTRLPRHYLERINNYLAGKEMISPSQLPFEFLMNALRLKEGVEERLFTQTTGLALATLEPKLSELRNKDLMVRDRLQCTPTGYLHLNTLLAEFVTD